MTDHNDHVLKWYRWRIWLAKQQGRLLAQTFLIEWYNQELRGTYQ
jgi:hypothetical protein